MHGNYYGTLISQIDKKLELGQNVILEIDVQGGIIAKSKRPDAILIFCRTEDENILENRLRARNTDSEEIILKRLENAKKELEYEKKYDYVIVNKELEISIQELINIINGENNGK